MISSLLARVLACASVHPYTRLPLALASSFLSPCHSALFPVLFLAQPVSIPPRIHPYVIVRSSVWPVHAPSLALIRIRAAPRILLPCRSHHFLPLVPTCRGCMSPACWYVSGGCLTRPLALARYACPSTHTLHLTLPFHTPYMARMYNLEANVSLIDNFRAAACV